MPPPNPPRPRQGSSPKLQGADVDKVVGGAQRQADLRGTDAGIRRGTNPNMAALKAPPLPLDFDVTVPAPAHDAPTQPSPPAVVLIEEVPYSQPPPSTDPHGRIIELERENERLRRGASEAPRGPWMKLGYKLAAAAVGAAVLVITALGARAVSMLDTKADVQAKTQKKTKTQIVGREKLWNNWGDRMIEVLECRHREQMRLNKRQFPETQRGEPGPWPIAKDACGELPERPRELPPAPPLPAAYEAEEP